MERENYRAHKSKLWSHQFKKQNGKFRASNQLVAVRLTSAGAKSPPQKKLPRAGEAQARPRLRSSILGNCLSEATSNWICQAPF